MGAAAKTPIHVLIVNETGLRDILQDKFIVSRTISTNVRSIRAIVELDSRQSRTLQGRHSAVETLSPGKPARWNRDGQTVLSLSSLEAPSWCRWPVVEIVVLL